MRKVEESVSRKHVVEIGCRRARGTQTQVQRELVGLAVVYDLFSSLLKDFIICSVLCVRNCIFLKRC